MKTMNRITKYIVCALALTGVTALGTSCQDNIDAPAMEVPVAASTPNTTIAQLKAQYWQDTDNYAATIGDETDPSKRTVIHGRVISSDEASNVFKSLVIQDETGALAFSINSYNLYLNYRVGQEIVMDVTGMYIGKYSGLMQMGMPDWYERGNTYQISFMAPEYFNSHVELNGIPEPAKTDTIQIPSIGMIGTTPADQQKYQSQLVCLQNVQFQEGGKALFSSYHSSGENRVITDAAGGTMNVRTSGYSTFWNTTLPEGSIDLVGILSFFNNAWQFILIDGDAWTAAPERPGAKDKPYTVDQAITSEKAGIPAQGWVKGYIVGAVAPGVEGEITGDDDIEWEAPTVLRNTLVIGQTPETRSLEHALVVYLTSQSAFEQYGNLRDNPGNFGKEIMVQGTLDKYLGTYGITGNNGSASTFSIEGVTIDTGEIAAGDGTEAKPYNAAQIIALNPTSTDAAVESGVWVKGYIVGYMPSTNTYLTNTVFGSADAVNTNLVVGPTADCTEYAKCIGIQLPKGDIRDALNLQANPGNLGKEITLKGDVMKYCGAPGIKNTSAYVLGEGGTTPPVVTPSDAIFESLSEDDQALSAGWTIENVNLGGLEAVWQWKIYNNKGYLNGSGFADNTAHATEAFCISPVIDLTTASAPVVSFEHAAKFQTTLRTLCGIYARAEGTSAWTKLSIPTWPDAGAWTFAKSGNIDLSAYAGKKMQIAFKYASSAEGADTWEIRNLSVKAQGTPDKPGDDPVTPPTPPATGEAVTVNAEALSDLNGGGNEVTVDGYKFLALQNAGPTKPAFNTNYGSVRLYAKNSLTISGAKMAKIVINIETKAGMKQYAAITSNTGTIAPQSSEDTTVTWTGSADSVTLTVGDKAVYGTDTSKAGQLHIASIEIFPAE